MMGHCRPLSVLAVWSLHALPLTTWVSSGNSGFLPHLKEASSLAIFKRALDVALVAKGIRGYGEKAGMGY